jgi:hemolysin activation/secretion protein
VMRPNLQADPADQFGGALRLRTARGLDPAGVRWGGELEVHGETGDYSFVRPSARLRAAVLLWRGVALGAEAAGGSAFGTVPAQRLWQLGGVGTLRGHDGGAARGEAFWRGRVELGSGMTFARVIGFTDFGWAGRLEDVQQGRALSSAGIGIGLLDGLLRFDVARAMRTGTWKFHMHFAGVL